MDDENVLYVYEVGDYVYKTPASMHELIAIVHEDYIVSELDRGIIDSSNDPCYVRFYTVSEWFDMIHDNRLLVWECASLKKKFIHKEHVRLLVKRNEVALRKEIIKLCNEH